MRVRPPAGTVKSAETRLEQLAARELERAGGLTALRAAMRELMLASRGVVKGIVGELPQVIEQILKGPVSRELGSRTRTLRAVLFDIADQPARRLRHASEVYRALLRKFIALLETPEFLAALEKNPSLRQPLEKLAAVLYERLARRVDRISVLKDEIEAYNRLVKRLFPEEYWQQSQVQNHHLIEERFFEKFKEFWKLLGWHTPEDMAAMPLHYELHNRSPMTLLKNPPPKEIVKSLTGMLKEIDIKKIKDVFQLLDEYEKIYGNLPVWNEMLPALAEIRFELKAQLKTAKLPPSH